MLRQLELDMDAILDAMEWRDELNLTTSYLDVETGQVGIAVDPAGSDEEESPWDDERWVPIPRRGSADDYRAMERFTEGLDDEEVRAELRAALGGRGPFRRFRGVLADHPDVRARWHAFWRERLLEVALDWLRGLGIEPKYDLRRVALPEPAASPGAAPESARIGLLDLLLLGAPDGKTELVDGRVHRVLVAGDATQARKAFLRIARELVEHEGLPWRKRLIEGRDHLEVGRHRLSVSEGKVCLEVGVPRAIWDAFAD
jgi:hypothetical protein